MMKTKYSLFIALWLSVTCSLFTACNDDEQPWNPEISDSENHSVIGEDQFIVSYSTTEEPSTRALSDNALKANERISSLHYYVYEKKTGELIKQRKIRGINKTTKWPICGRDSMPWELRQDLQDTLVAGYTYRILFIANIDSTLFKLPDGTPHPAVVRNVNNYATAQILLPQVPFCDNNMYYLWEDSLKADANTTTKRNDVLLRRLVTRTDVQRKEIKNWRQHLYDTIANSAYKAQEKEIIASMDKHLDDFCARMNNKMTGDYKYKAQEMIQLLKTDSVRERIHAAMKEKIVTEYTDIIDGVKCFQKTNEWTLADNVKVTYQANTRVNALTFSRQPLHLTDGLTDCEEVIPVKGGRFSIVSFLTDKNKTNTITSVSFTTANIATDFTLADTIFHLGEEMNRWYEVTCNPVDKIKINTTNYYDKKLLKFDFTEILKGIKEWDELYSFTLPGEKSFIYYVEHNVFDIVWSEDVYGNNFKDFWFHDTKVLQLPDVKTITNKDVTIVPSWSKKIHN